MKEPFSLIVTDTSPLITLAYANSLDTLLQAHIQVRIPDAVYIEATRIRAAVGAGEIVDWISGNLDRVMIVPTEIGIDQQRRIEEGRPIRGLGENAAIEALDRYFSTSPNSQALLLFEDSDLVKRRAIVDERVSLLTTGDFLRALEQARLIQSADHILDLAAERGRNVDRQRGPDNDRQTASLLSAQLGRGVGPER